MNNFKAHDYPRVYQDLGINLSKLGCVMLDVEPLSNMYSIELEGGSCALYYAKNKERFWINGWVIGKHAHITLLYGLLNEAKNYETHIERVLSGWSLNEVEIDHVSFFDSPYDDEPYWAIVAHIKVTDKLLEGHERLCMLPHIKTFPGFRAHMTICYLDKAQGIIYREKMIDDFNNLWKGKKLKVKNEINLGGNKS